MSHDENGQDGARQLVHSCPTVDFVQEPSACAMSALQLSGLEGIVASDTGLRIPAEALEWAV